MSARLLMLCAALLGGCGAAAPEEQAGRASPPAIPESAATAIFAGGCFWCTEADFEKLPGVHAAESGYIGGTLQNPRYEDTHDGKSGHTEAVRVHYDPDAVSYDALLRHFFLNHDPLDAAGQFCDKGNQYRPGIFYLDAAQKAAAEAYRADIATRLDATVQTEVTQATRFWPAEDYHQDYYKKNPVRYRFYRANCGRDGRLAELRDKLQAE